MREIGHLLGLKHYKGNYPNACTQQSNQSSVMNDTCGVNDNGTYFGSTFYPSNQTTTVKNCDYNQLNPVYTCPEQGCYIPVKDSSENELFVNSSQMRPPRPRDCSEWGLVG
jgi:hypothetical protein